MADEFNNKFEVDTTDRLSGKQLQKIIEDFNQDQYLINQAYYKGENVEIIAEGAENAVKGQVPNNIIPLPFARRTIHDLVGYSYTPGNVKYVFDDKESDKVSIEKVESVLKDNGEPLESAEIFSDSSIKGEGAELTYFADRKVQFAKIPREQAIFEYEDTIKQDSLKWSIRFYIIIEITPDGDDLITHKAEVYWPERADFYQWTETDDLVNRDPQKKSSRFDSNSEEEYNYLSSIRHPFKKVPLYPYNINADKLGVFQPSIPIINKMDELGSDSLANSIDQFNDTMLVMSKSLTPEDAKKIKDSGVFDGIGGKEEGNFVEFLQRNLNIEGTLETTLLMERWYYELTAVPNLYGERFGIKSGIAMLYALVPFENLVTTMEIYFTKGLQYRLDLINNALIFLNEISEPVIATLKWTRNLPFDKKELTDIVVELKKSGLLSDETILKMFPKSIIENVDEEIKRKKDQDDEAMEKFLSGEAARTTQPDADTKDEDDE